MTQTDLADYFESLLRISQFAQDASQNGIQVENSGQKIEKIAFAVDACAETILRAKKIGAQMLFVHHGLFWHDNPLVQTAHRVRIKTLLDADIALFACHIPLDAHETLGNNACLADAIGLQNRVPFGVWRGMNVGFIGDLDGQTDLRNIEKNLSAQRGNPLGILPFGAKFPKKCAVISGGATGELGSAIAAKADLFLTGEISHQMYHSALENGISVLAMGHYQSETGGVKRVVRQVSQDLQISCEFLDVPTGL